ncbi:MAG: hypothetical protein Q8S18_06335 [Bacteroidales bacterium]|nr:hypothetical protein [Bacteroidales bacterium]
MSAKRMLLLVVLLIGVSQFITAQDIILKRNDEMIHCKIKEIGLDEIKYSLPDHSQDILFVIAKDDISKVVLENGKEMTFEKRLTDPGNYLDNKKNALKIDFLSPLTGNTSLSYERSLRPGRSLEGTLGIIGLGLDAADRNAGGAFVKFGMKFIKDPDFYLRGMQYAHLLKGSYVKPEISFGFFSHNQWEYFDKYDENGYWIGYQNRVREDVFSGTIQLVLGKQWIFDNAFLIDIYGGLGYGFSTNNYDGGYMYGYSIAGSDFPISVSGGLKIGLLFK